MFKPGSAKETGLFFAPLRPAVSQYQKPGSNE